MLGTSQNVEKHGLAHPLRFGAGVPLLVAILAAVAAGWNSEYRLTVDPHDSYTSPGNAKCVTASGTNVHVVWQDNRTGFDEIYYQRSTSRGRYWVEGYKQLTFNQVPSVTPAVAVSGSYVHVVWNRLDNGAGIRYANSADGGDIWLLASYRAVSHGSVDAQNPSVAAAGSSVHVVWVDSRNGTNVVYYNRSDDNGITWKPADVQLSTAPSYYPSIATQGNAIAVVWQDGTGGSDYVDCKTSTDGGVSWTSQATQLGWTEIGDVYPSITAADGAVYVAWLSCPFLGMPFQLEYCKGQCNGTSWNWSAPTIGATLNTSPLVEDNTSVAAGHAVHIVWEHGYPGSEDIRYERTTNGGSSWSSKYVSSAPNFSGYPSVAVCAGCVHVVWTDRRDGNCEIYYRRNPFGEPGWPIPWWEYEIIQFFGVSRPRHP